MAELLPPTGLRIESYVRDNIAEWLGSDDSSVVGYNVYVSSTSGGGQSRYVRLNNVVVTAPFRTEDIVEEESADTVETMLGAAGMAEQTTVIRKKVRKAPVFRLRHRNVDINSKQFYVVTSVDASGSESGYSTELTGETTRIDSQVVHVPPREFNAIVNGMIDTFLRRDPEVDLKPGTVFRDLVIDPPAFEMEKLWFFLNFVDKATSMVALRAVDDENDDSISDPVSQSDYKQRLRAALGLTSDEDTQTLIDYAMEKLASNARVFRKGATRAQGEAVFYAVARPTGDVEIPAGASVWTASTESGAVIAFSTTVSVNVSAGDLDLHYSAANARYEFAAPIVANATGPGGNVSAGAIVKATTGQFAVTNPAPTFGGDVQENNSLFSERAVLKMSSLDVGTRKGYRRVLIEQPGVLDVYVAAAGDALMQRDFIRHISPDGSAKSEHIFGKVDAWVRGGESVIFEDRAGFLYSRVEGEEFKVVERVSAFTIETTNPAVSETQPIFDVERITRRRPGVPDADYTLDNLVFDDGGRRLTIDTQDATNVAIGLKDGDTVTATYRFRGSSPIVLLHQPATSVVSVEGLNSGPLDEGTHYEFLQRDDFLLNGRSVLGGSAVHLKYDGPSRKPIGTIESFSERTGSHAGFVLTQEFRALSKRGIVSGSIVAKTIPSAGDSPVALELNRHYIVETDPAGVTSIKLIGNDSRFTSGVRYAVSYQFGEEIIIRYRANNLVGRLQAVIDRSKHEAADVLVKSAIPVDIDIVFSFKVMPSADALDVKQAVGTAARSFVAGRRLGESVYESDLIRRVQQVAGVKHVILPMSKLGRTSGNYETETIRSAWSEVTVGTDESGSPISYWQTQQNALGQNTIGTSAEPNEFWGLRENGAPLDVVADLTALVARRGTFFIDATGTVFVNPKSVDEIGNPFNDRDPNANEYRVTYRIAGESGSQDIVIQPNEYARLADFIIEAVE